MYSGVLRCVISIIKVAIHRWPCDTSRHRSKYYIIVKIASFMVDPFGATLIIVMISVCVDVRATNVSGIGKFRMWYQIMDAYYLYPSCMPLAS